MRDLEGFQETLNTLPLEGLYARILEKAERPRRTKRMIAIPVSDVKEMMKSLLLKEDFDSFYLTEASITTFVTYTIDGQLRHDFYDAGGAEELKAKDEYFTRWGECAASASR